MNSIGRWKNKGITNEKTVLKYEESDYLSWSRCFVLLLVYEGKDEDSSFFGLETQKWMSFLSLNTLLDLKCQNYS